MTFLSHYPEHGVGERPDDVSLITLSDGVIVISRVLPLQHRAEAQDERYFACRGPPSCFNNISIVKQDQICLTSVRECCDFYAMLSQSWQGYACTTSAMDWAAAFGQVKVVKWLSENRTEGCTKDAMGEGLNARVRSQARAERDLAFATNDGPH